MVSEVCGGFLGHREIGVQVTSGEMAALTKPSNEVLTSRRPVLTTQTLTVLSGPS